MEFSDINISEVIFKKQLVEREFCVIFLVEFRGKTCAMKVVGGSVLVLKTYDCI